MSNLASRFWPKVDIRGDDDCWPWLGACKGPRGSVTGYGRILVQTTPPKRWELAHRVAYRLTIGPIPDGMSVLHHCDSPPCCNSQHFFLGTHQDNMDDRTRKNRHVIRSGEQNGAHKLTVDVVRNIRGDSTVLSISDLARRYSVSRRQVRRIVTGVSWREVEPCFLLVGERVG